MQKNILTQKEIIKRPLTINTIGERVFDALRNNRITFEIFATLISVLLSFPVLAQQQNSECNENELNISGENYLPTEITVEELNNLYILVCEYMQGQETFSENSVSIVMQPVKQFDNAENEFVDFAYAYVSQGRNRNVGIVEIAAGSSSLSHDGKGFNPDFWRMVIMHEFSHLFGSIDDSTDSLKGIFYATWWNLITQYAAVDQCNLLEDVVLDDKNIALEVCEDASEIVNES